MMTEEMEENKINKETYEKKFQEGYGIRYPESHIIRIYETFIKPKIGNMLDFGCGTGAHLQYFASKGFDIYGVDTSKTAIDLCKMKMPDEREYLKVVSPGEIFDFGKMDVILANQSLYYLSNKDFDKTLKQLHNMLKDDGVIIATMIGTKNYYYNLAEKGKDDLQRVCLKGRLNEITYINFTKSEINLLNKFRLFKPMFVGSYDFTHPEGSGFHYYFIGKKK